MTNPEIFEVLKLFVPIDHQTTPATMFSYIKQLGSACVTYYHLQVKTGFVELLPYRPHYSPVEVLSFRSLEQLINKEHSLRVWSLDGRTSEFETKSALGSIEIQLNFSF